METRGLFDSSGYFGLLGRSPAIRQHFEQIQLVAPLETPVLLEGGPGSGKTTAAHALHESSGRCDGPFLVANAAEISPLLFEAELFGSPGEASLLPETAGLLNDASGGTLYLKQISDLPLEKQAVLRAYLDDAPTPARQGREGSRYDVRLICGSSRDLSRETALGRFDEALYNRLRAFTLRVPPLRERQEDLPLLIQHFLEQAMIQHGKEVGSLSRNALELLLAHRWEGNVRQLMDEMERAVILTSSQAPVEASVLSPEIHSKGESV